MNILEKQILFSLFFLLVGGSFFAENKMIYLVYSLILIIHLALTLRIRKKAELFALLVHHVLFARSGLTRARMRNFQNK